MEEGRAGANATAKPGWKDDPLLFSGGIRAIWNFAPIGLKVPDGVVVHNEDLAASLAVFLQKHALVAAEQHPEEYNAMLPEPSPEEASHPSTLPRRRFQKVCDILA